MRRAWISDLIEKCKRHDEECGLAAYAFRIYRKSAGDFLVRARDVLCWEDQESLLIFRTAEVFARSDEVHIEGGFFRGLLQLAGVVAEGVAEVASADRFRIAWDDIEGLSGPIDPDAKGEE